jgi:putative flippase GtrA
MYALTTWLGVYYLISNLISLAVLTILRYFLADSWIWGSPQKGADPIRETVL